MTLQSPRPFTLFVGFDSNNDTIPAADRVGNLSRNTYKGDSMQTWDVHLQRTFHFSKEGMKLEAAVDAFNLLNHTNVDEVNGVYGTYNFCGGSIPTQYKDAASQAIQAGPSRRCPVAGPPVPNSLFGTPRTMFNLAANATVAEAAALESALNHLPASAEAGWLRGIKKRREAH